MATLPMRHVLAATDFSDNAEAALALAVRYASAVYAGLHVLHVFAPGETNVTVNLAAAVAKAAPDVPVRVAATSGDPAREILRYAAQHPINLIVLGAHCRRGVNAEGVADRVIRGARCPVLVVPAASVETAASTSTQAATLARAAAPRSA